jgi:hypothetical protein
MVERQMKISTVKLREIIEEEVANLAEEDVELEPEAPEELELSGPEKLRAEMPVEELAQVVMKLIGAHPEGVEVLKMAFDELYGLEVAEYEEEEMDPHTPIGPEAEPVKSRIGFEESLETFIQEELSAVLKEYTEVDPIGRAQQRLDRVPFMEWIAQVEELGFQFGEDSPNPYDAWLLSSTPQDYVQQGGVELEEEKAKNNPWAICTAEVGREDKEKYERCVKSVKKGD